MSKKYTIRHRVFGDDYLEDENGNKIELKRPLFDDPHYEIDGGKLYPEKNGRVLSKRGILRDEEKYEKRVVDSILKEYKTISKKILEWIGRQSNKEYLYGDLYQRRVCETINLIKREQIKEAIYHYKTIVKEYEKRSATGMPKERTVRR